MIIKRSHTVAFLIVTGCK